MSAMADYYDNDELAGTTYREAVIAKAQWLDALARDAQVPVTTRGVGLVVASYYNRQKGRAWPSTTELGERCGMSPRQVIRHLNALEVAGYLLVERTANRGQGKRRAGYRFEVPARVALRSLDGGAA